MHSIPIQGAPRAQDLFSVAFSLERYRLHPCYPLTDGPPAENANDALIFVVDENFEPDRLQAHSADAVLQNFQAMLRDIFALPPEWP